MLAYGKEPCLISSQKYSLFFLRAIHRVRAEKTEETEK